MCQPGDVLSGALPGPQPHVEGVEREVGAQAGGHLPSHHHPGEHVEDERGVDPARMGADIGQVGHPELVGRGGDEAPLDQVSGPFGLGAVGVGGLAGLVPHDPAQPLGSHQSLNGALRT